MKTLEELQTELATIEQALVETRKLANERATVSYQLQVIQTGVLLGNKTTSDLQQAQAQLQATVDALVKVPLLEQAVADARKMVEECQFQDRKKHVDGIKKEFDDVYERYGIESKKLLAIYRDLQRLDNQYRAMARAGSLPELLGPYHRELNLPAVTGPLSTRSGFSTGQEP
jgi:hypothetical protein